MYKKSRKLEHDLNRESSTLENMQQKHGELGSKLQSEVDRARTLETNLS
jgi:hypothetical protein